ncbi:MAG: AzlD domain-containing protein [Elainellaceae cyanobacterium]
MLTPSQEVLLISSMAIATLAIRAVPIVMSGRIVLSDRMLQLLRYVPPVVLTAIIVPAVLMDGQQIALTYTNPRLIGAIAAIGVGLWRKNLLLTIAVGMAVFFLWQAILSQL